MSASKPRSVMTKLALQDAENQKMADEAKLKANQELQAKEAKEIAEKAEKDKAEKLRIEKERIENEKDGDQMSENDERSPSVNEVFEGAYQVQILREKANVAQQKQLLAATELEKEKELTEQKKLDVEAMKLKLALFQAEESATFGAKMARNEGNEMTSSLEVKKSGSFIIDDDRKTTISTKREFQGMANNLEFRRALTENSVATIDAAKEWFASTARLPKDLHNLGGQAWKVWYNALTSLYDKAKNMQDVYRENEILPQVTLFTDVLDSCIQDSRSDRELDGVLQFVSVKHLTT